MHDTRAVRSVVQVFTFCVVMVLATVSTVHSGDFYVDPDYLGTTADGSTTKPWRSLQAVIDRRLLEAGDTVYLRSGDYGGLWINGQRNQATVTIAADRGHVPRFVSIRISASTKWHLRGLSVSTAFAPSGTPGTMIKIDRRSEAITVENCVVMSVADSSSWTAADWNAKAAHGIVAGGTQVTLRGNRLKNVNHGIDMRASHSIVENNLVENFSGDGMRGLGDYTIFKSNTVKNCYKVNSNHDDGFQSWSVGEDGKPGTGQVVGVVISGNTIINYEDPNQPLRCALAGIGLYDGTYVDWVIENNVVIVDHWHGITVMGARHVRVVNNTVIDPNGKRPGPPWVTITPHKNGTPPENSFIFNNLAPSFNRRGFAKGRFPTGPTGVILRNNMVVRDTRVFFEDAANGDLRLKPGSRAVDAGTPDMAPATDIEGSPRPRGKGVDLGAYELQ